MSLIDLQKKIAEEERKYFREALRYASQIREVAEELLNDKELRVLVFGSTVRGDAIPGKSDIDILIVSEKAPTTPKQQAELRTKILKSIGDLSAPFEIHVITPEVYRRWYSGRIGKGGGVIEVR